MTRGWPTRRGASPTAPRWRSGSAGRGARPGRPWVSRLRDRHRALQEQIEDVEFALAELGAEPPASEADDHLQALATARHQRERAEVERLRARVAVLESELEAERQPGNVHVVAARHYVQDMATLIEQYAAGASVASLAKRNSLTRSNIYDRLRRSPRWRSIREQQAAALTERRCRARELLAAGWTVKGRLPPASAHPGPRRTHS